MSAIAPSLEAFFTERLGHQLEASPHTVAGYRDALRLFVTFAATRTHKEPSALDFADIDAEVVGAFLDHLEHDRHNGVRTRNVRLSALRSFFRYASYREPAHAELIARVLAIPEKRVRRHVVSFLTHAELEALVASPARDTWHGRRDHALLVVAAQSGLRVARAGRAATRRRRPRHRRSPARAGQGEEGALCPAHPPERGGAARVAQRTRRSRR